DAYVWDMSGDGSNTIIAGTRAKLADGSDVALYLSCDGGASWGTLRLLGHMPEWSGVLDITRFDTGGNAYYTCWDPNSGYNSYRFHLELTSAVEPVVPPSVHVEIVCSSPSCGSVDISLISDSRTRLAEVGVYNLMGRRVASVYTGPVGPGRQTLSWNGKDVDGCSVPSGVYFVRLHSPDATGNATVVLVR
ncbi:hypothetical protein K8S17_02630, partial [bacterium]|nr:hypothetical protein [bacterium]